MTLHKVNDTMTRSTILNDEELRRHDISLCESVSIDEIEVINYDGTMVDIEVEDDHTFYVSDTKDEFVLTHNSSWPDIDCLRSNHLVKTPSGPREMRSLHPGDKIYDHMGFPRRIQYVQTRPKNDKDIIVDIHITTETGVKGVIVATSKHRLLDEMAHEISVKDLEVGTRLYCNNAVINVTQIVISPRSAGEVTDITVEEVSTFQVYPFDIGAPEIPEMNSFLAHDITAGSHNSDAGDRDVLIDAARTLYGDDAVIPVSNFNTLKLKSLIKDISKFYDIPFNEINEVTGQLQEEVMPHAKNDDQEKSVFVLTHEDCMKYSPRYKSFMEKYPEVAKHVESLFMQNKSCFTKDTVISTQLGDKKFSEIDPHVDDIAYVDTAGCVRYNNEYEVYFAGNKEIYKITTDDSTILSLTGDHEVLTQNGYTRVDQLSEDDVLVEF